MRSDASERLYGESVTRTERGTERGEEDTYHCNTAESISCQTEDGCYSHF